MTTVHFVGYLQGRGAQVQAAFGDLLLILVF